MRVNIYVVDYEKESKGDLIGTVEYVRGKIEVRVEDTRILKIINKKLLKSKSFRKSQISTLYYISPAEFLQLLGIECWKNGYVAEVI